MTLALVKQERLWYTDAMKVLLSFSKRMLFGMLLLPLLCLLCCIPQDDAKNDENDVQTEKGEEAHPIIFPVYSSAGMVSEASFFQACSSEHAMVYVSAHAVKAESAQELLEAFEETIFPAMSEPTILEDKRLSILISFMEGNVYGYMPSELQEGEQGPVVYLNALFVDDLSYALAHEYQHLCAYDACKAGDTVISEETDELLSDMFTELLFPCYGQEHGILSEERTLAAQERIEAWGEDALSHAYDLMRAGYSEKELLSTLENR